jgi:hypothetical protein
MPKTMNSNKMNIPINKDIEETKVDFGSKIKMSHPKMPQNQQRFSYEQKGINDKIRTADKRNKIIEKTTPSINKNSKNLKKQANNGSTKKPKSGWSFFNVFSWGCKGKSNEASVPKPKIRNIEFKPGMKLGQRDIKSEQNAKSYNDNSLLYDDSNWNNTYFQEKHDVIVDKINIFRSLI